MDEMNENVSQLVDEQVQSENWRDRLIAEHQFVSEKQAKLGVVLEAYLNDTLDVELNCPIELLFAQFHAMTSYLAILELRINILGSDEPQPEVTD